MKKKEIENMLNGIDDMYLAEAIGSARVTVKPYRKIAAAVVLGLVGDGDIGTCGNQQQISKLDSLLLCKGNSFGAWQGDTSL